MDRLEADTSTPEEHVAFSPISSYRNVGTYTQDHLTRFYTGQNSVCVCVCVHAYARKSAGVMCTHALPNNNRAGKSRVRQGRQN